MSSSAEQLFLRADCFTQLCSSSDWHILGIWQTANTSWKEVVIFYFINYCQSIISKVLFSSYRGTFQKHARTITCKLHFPIGALNLRQAFGTVGLRHHWRPPLLLPKSLRLSPLLLIQLPAKPLPGRQQMMAQLLGSLHIMWATQRELLSPGPSPAQPRLSWVSGE